MESEKPRKRVFTDQNMAVERLLPFAGGEVALFSARGPDKNGANEDGAAVVAVDAGRGVLAVADGMGGQPGGENAAEAALSSLKNAVGRSDQNGALRSAILDGIERANRSVLELGIGAATTLSVAEISDGTLRSYQVGDSAILVVGQRGRIKLQTLSQSPVGYAVESGMLDEEEAMHHEERHLVSNMVGAPDMRIDVGSSLRLAPRDTVLIATDGLLDNLSQPEIVELIRTKSLSSVARQMASLCTERMCEPRDGEPSKPDDVTFILFRMTASG